MPVDIIVTQFVSRGASQLVSTLNQVGSRMAIVESRNERLSRLGTTWASAGIAGGVALGVLATKSAKAAGQVERVHVGFQTMLGSASKADSLLKQVYALDKETPFDFLTTANLAQQGLASGFREDLIPTMRAVATATVAAGKGTEVYARAMAIVSKIKATGQLSQVRLNQFGAAGIPAREILKKQLGLSDDDMVNIGKLHLKADVVIPALVKGFNEEYKGALEKASKTLLGSAEILEGSRDKLLASIGKAILPDVTGGIQLLTKLTDKAQEFVALHPRMTKGLLYGGGAAAATATIYGGVTALKMATDARKLLKRAVDADAKSELAKTAIAGREGAAIANVGKNAVGTAGKLGLLARASAFVRSPLSIGGTSLRGLGAFGGRATLGTLGAEGGVATLGLTTVGGAALSAGLGLGVGYQARGNMKAAGYSDGKAAAYGVATGISAGLTAMFVPGGAIAVAAGAALAGLINKLYNEPMENKPENKETPKGELDPDQKLIEDARRRKHSEGSTPLAEAYAQLSSEARSRGDDQLADLYQMQSASFRRQSRRERTPGTKEWENIRDTYAREQQTRLESWSWKDQQERARRQELSDPRAPKADTGIVTNVSANKVETLRNGTQKITLTLNLPMSAGDRRARSDDYAVNSPYTP